MPQFALAASLSGLIALTALAGQCAAQATLHEPAKNPPARETYLRLADEVEKHLRTQVLGAWFPRCIDREHGGFLPHFREDWSAGDRNDKSLVFQSRMTWVASEVSQRYPDLAPQYLDYARHGLDCLEKTMWDRERGGPFWGLDRSGKITESYGTQKHAYGIAFAIYGASAAYEATKQQRALDLAKRTFAWLDEHAHDRVHGGYYEALSRSGEPILAPPSADRKTDQIGTRYGYKSMNTHIHLLEALTALRRVWPDAVAEARLREVFLLVRDRIAVEPGCLHQFFTPDWRPVPEHDSFGHDVETAYLLIEAAEALKQPDDAKTVAVARRLVDHALEWGWDEQHGGFYDRGAAFSPACGREKIWWTQAEGLNALLLMHGRFGRQSPRYFHAFLRQWDFICNYQADRRHGEWYESVSPEGTPKPGQDKGTVWKAAYHNGRALMNVSRALRELAK